MARDSTIAAIRFGYGLGRGADPEGGAEILDLLAAGDRIGGQFPVRPTPEVLREIGAFRAAKKANQGSDNPDQATREALVKSSSLGLVQGLSRILDTTDAFRERLVWFWADHFTAIGKNLPQRAAGPAYVDEAIRPHLTGRFADMLKAVVTHPFMLTYLDQAQSTGPNSRVGQRRGRGLNENLAREVLELHTLGVSGAYGQADVRQFAELLTGLTVTLRKGFVFNPQMAEPGAETLLGKTYGGGKARLGDIYQALEDLARHPYTARHLAHKLAVHFVSDTPEPALVAHMAEAYQRRDGDLMAMYRALLEHPAAWAPLGQKAKQPFDFIASSLVALGVNGREFGKLGLKQLRRQIAQPLTAMGQPFMSARGPDGWPEEASAWITPQGLAVRIAWATAVPKVMENRLPDPAAFLARTLADHAGAGLTRAIGQIRKPSDGVALVLASAEFNRR